MSSVTNELSINFADTMPRFAEIAKQRKSRAKKLEKEDKKRKTPPAEDEAFVPEPTAPKSKSLTIKEPIAQAPSLPPPVEGKGKEKMDELVRPPKRSRHAKESPLPVPSTIVPKANQGKTVKAQLSATLNPTAEDTGFTMVNDYAKWLGQCATSVAPETWNHILVDQPNSLLSFGLMSSFIVSVF